MALNPFLLLSLHTSGLASGNDEYTTVHRLLINLFSQYNYPRQPAQSHQSKRERRESVCNVDDLFSFLLTFSEIFVDLYLRNQRKSCKEILAKMNFLTGSRN